MKKIIILFAFLITINLLGNVDFGLKIGVNSNKIYMNELHPYENSYDRKIGFLIGGVLKYQLPILDNGLFFEIDFLYNQKGTIVDEDSIELNYTIHYLEFPLMIGYNYKRLFSLKVGGYFSFYKGSKREGLVKDRERSYDDYTEYDILDDGYKDKDYGVVLSTSFHFKKFEFEIRYTRSIIEQNRYPETYFVERMDYFDQWSFNIGYFF